MRWGALDGEPIRKGFYAMSKPLIGLTTGRILMPAERGRSQDVLMGCPQEYAMAVEAWNAAAVMIPPMGDEDSARRVIDLLDGLILTGGGDPLPEYMNAEPHPQIRGIDPYRDRTETALILAAMEKNLPILGICKGAQAINIALGGDLIQHIPDTTANAVGHWQRAVVPCGIHTIDIEPQTLFARLMGGASTLRVNSYHHQAIGRLGQGLQVAARARDGIIEAIEADDGRPILGLQYHPEELVPCEAHARAVFEWLIAQARQR